VTVTVHRRRRDGPPTAPRLAATQHRRPGYGGL